QLGALRPSVAVEVAARLRHRRARCLGRPQRRKQAADERQAVATRHRWCYSTRLVRASDFDYELPPAHIAQAPVDPRDRARLYVLDRAGGAAHAEVRDLPALLPAGALLVVNDTRVIPARLRGTKPTGGRVELLLVEPLASPPGTQRWRCLGGA